MIAKRFGGDEIKRVAVSPFFMNTYYLCDDNHYHFFGKPILYLTNFQTALMSFAKNFKYLMSNHKPPTEDYAAHPDKIIEWYDMQSKTAMAQDYDDKGEASGKSYFGADKEELKAIKKEDDYLKWVDWVQKGRRHISISDDMVRRMKKENLITEEQFKAW